MASDKGVPVELYIYDLTHGMAALLSPAILGRQVSGVWHTSVVVYEREYFYGGAGVTSCAPGGTQLGQPHQVERLGETFVPFSVFVDYIQGLATTTYTGGAYRLLEHNCNHFSEEVSQFLCGAHVPKHILTQPDALPPPLRLAVQALLDNVLPTPQGPADGVRRARDESPEYFTLNQQIEQARAQGAALEQRRSTLAEKLARKERRREKKRKKHARASGDMAEAVEAYPAEELSAGPSGPSGPSGASRPADPDVDDQPEERRLPKEPPIVYKDIDGTAEYEKLAAALQTLTLTPEEQQSLQELQQYLVQGEGSWVLGDDFLAFIGRILTDPSMSSAREPTLRCLAAAALREDVSLVLHQDRKHHALLTYAHGIDTHPAPEQQALALFMCNLFCNISSSEWLLYISEWDHAGQPLSNIRATTKVCVHATLSEDPELRELGTALMYNVATKEVKTVVFDEVCIELAMALLQLLAWAPSEEHMFRACLALARLAAHSADVPQLVAMVDVEPSAFLGTSARVDEQINLFVKKLK